MSLIEYVYSAHSAFAYLGSKELARISAKAGATVIHKPILLSPVVEAQGGMSFRQRSQAHADYFFGREIERWAEYRAVLVISHRPSYHDADYSLASGVILALRDRGPDVDAMAHELLAAHWRDDADLSSLSTLASLISAAGFDSVDLLERAASPDVQGRLKANTDWAIKQGVLGSPTYIVDGDPFFGQDRLQLVEHALVAPFAPPNWINPIVG
ncbi:MAG: DsbA family protein [Pseudomonadota bacterium]